MIWKKVAVRYLLRQKKHFEYVQRENRKRNGDWRDPINDKSAAYLDGVNTGAIVAMEELLAAVEKQGYLNAYSKIRARVK